uniref:Uncharacterized protein n=1 Tax=Biomphalaria glabrata TaxID=6526 RepID=A0A2C9LXL1_BIOGL
MAVELGYETLVGNLLYIEIPHGTDINRSWQNYLSEDTMEWGFPYYKGTSERPRMRQPEPYLAHQVSGKCLKGNLKDDHDHTFGQTYFPNLPRACRNNEGQFLYSF